MTRVELDGREAWVTAERLRQLAAEHDATAAQMRSAALLLEQDADNPDVPAVVEAVIGSIRDGWRGQVAGA